MDRILLTLRNSTSAYCKNLAISISNCNKTNEFQISTVTYHFFSSSLFVCVDAVYLIERWISISIQTKLHILHSKCKNMNTENVLVSLTVVQKFSTVFQSRSEKHRTETFSKHWWRSGYGMRSHPTEKLDYIKILTYYNLYLYLYSYFFLFHYHLSSWLSL